MHKGGLSSVDYHPNMAKTFTVWLASDDFLFSCTAQHVSPKRMPQCRHNKWAPPPDSWPPVDATDNLHTPFSFVGTESAFHRDSFESSIHRQSSVPYAVSGSPCVTDEHNPTTCTPAKVTQINADVPLPLLPFPLVLFLSFS